MARLIIGLILSPLNAYIIWWVWQLPKALSWNSDLFIIGGSPVFILAAYIITFLGALPWILFFRKKGWVSIKCFIGLGISLGAAPILIFGITNLVYTAFFYTSQLLNIPTDLPDFFGLVSYAMLTGFLCSLLFWIISVQNNIWFTEKDAS